MNYFNKISKYKYFIILGLLVVLSIVFIIILFNVEINKTTKAILQVDSNKNMSIQFSTSNISLITEQKRLAITIENKIYWLDDLEFVYQGKNNYIINFTNDDLYHLLKTNSVYEVNIFYGSKKIIDFIFNI